MISHITQLNEFKLECKSTSTTSEPILWMERLGPDTLNQFQKYLTAIKKVDFNLKGGFKTNLIEYWPFVSKVIANNRSTPTHIRLEIQSRHPRETMLIKHEDIIYIDCMMDVTDFQLTKDSPTSPILLQTIMAPSELSENNVQTFHIEFKPVSEDPVIMDYRFKILESVTSTFRNLKYFGMDMDISLRPSFHIAVGSMETPLCAHSSCSYGRAKYLQRRLMLPSDVLAHAMLNSVESTKKITSILNLFPDIKILRLFECNLTQDGNFNITLDLQNLQLQQLVIELSNLVYEGQGLRTFILEIEESGLNRTSAFKWKRERRKMENMKFEPVEASYSRKFGRLSSPKYTTIFIKCRTLKQIKLYTNYERRNGSFTSKVDLDHDT